MEERNVNQSGERARLHIAPMAAGVPNGMSNKANLPAMPMADKHPLDANLPSSPAMAYTGDMTTNNASKPNMPNAPGMPEMEACGYKTGDLPACAPLAAGYVPYQRMGSPKYAKEDALTHGTLFPGLDLPFMNAVNKNNPYAGTPLGELMAIDFAIHELALYLDTHKDDKEAFEMQKTLIALDKEGRSKYEKLYGPFSMRDMEKADHYTWLKDPWPWEYAERGK